MRIILSLIITLCSAQWILLREKTAPDLTTGPSAQPETVPLVPMWHWQDSLYMYGQHMWKYEISEKRWFWQPDTPNVPVRSSAAHWTVQNKFYLYGGMSNSLGIILNDLWSYDPVIRLFQALPSSEDCAGMAFWPHETSNKLYAWGGFCGNETVNTLRAFDVNSQQWTILNAPNGPAPAKNAAATLVGENTVYLYTDDKLWTLDLSVLTWTLVEVTGNTSPPGPLRSYHVMWTNAQGNAFYLYGGQSGSKNYDDTWMFSNNQWTLVDVGNGPDPDWGLGFTRSGGNVYVFLDGNVWKYGKLTVRNIFQLIDWKLDSATFSATIAAIMSSLVFFALVILAVSLCVRFCIRRKKKNRFSESILRRAEDPEVEL